MCQSVKNVDRRNIYVCLKLKHPCPILLPRAPISIQKTLIHYHFLLHLCQWLPYPVFFFLLFISFADGRAHPKQSSHIITPGSSLFPTTQPSSWLSPSSRFAFGFYQLQGSTSFAVGIWLVGKHNTTVVWTAIRDDPPITTNATLDFTKNGMLLSRTELIANATGSASYAVMLDSGNFPLCDKDSNIVWQSFEHPTDTILGGQTLFAGGQLFSNLAKINHSTVLNHLSYRKFKTFKRRDVMDIKLLDER